jgi:hypothetical protein
VVADLRPLYAQAVDRLPEHLRIQILLAVIPRVEEQSLTVCALFPFLFTDPSLTVISTAALHAAATWPGTTEEDPLFGVRELLNHARVKLSEGRQQCAAGIVGGLLRLGDRRATEFLRHVWREFTSEGRSVLVGLKAVGPNAALIDWFIDWLEDSEGADFGRVAGALARHADDAKRLGVAETSRALPIWSRQPSDAVSLISHRTREEFAELIRPRLLQLAANEPPPRVMHRLLSEWGIDEQHRMLPGIAMHAPAADNSPRDLLPLMPRNTAPGVVFDLVQLTDADLRTRAGNIFLCWGIFNPFGPTWSTIGFLPTENPDVDLLVFRMMNPFGQESGAVAMLRREDKESPATIGRLVRTLFSRNALDNCRTGTELIGIASPPDFVLVPSRNPEFTSFVREAFLASPRMIECDITASVRQIREYPGVPWQRVTAQLENAQQRVRPGGLALPPQREGETTPDLLSEWFTLVTADRVVLPELASFPAAWHGAIDHATEEFAQCAFTFWQLDDFLARNRYPIFRNIAEMMQGR